MVRRRDGLGESAAASLELEGPIERVRVTLGSVDAPCHHPEQVTANNER